MMEFKDLKIDDLSPVGWFQYGREALDLLSRIVDDEECSYDHHGFCQTHCRGGKPCPHERARELLSELEYRKEGE